MAKNLEKVVEKKIQKKEFAEKLLLKNAAKYGIETVHD